MNLRSNPVQEIKDLLEVMINHGKPITAVDIHATRPHISELIPALLPVINLSLSFAYMHLEDDQMLHKLNLEKFSLQWEGCTKRGTQELHDFIASRRNLKEVTLTYSYRARGMDPFAPYSVLEAALSSPTVKKLVTNIAFQVFKNRNIKDITFTMLNYDSAFANRRILMNLWYLFESAQRSKLFLPPKTITLVIRVHLTVPDFLAILNKFLFQCDHFSTHTQLIVKCYDIHEAKFGLMQYEHFTYTYPGHTGRMRCKDLRREPYLSSSTLKKAQSLCDLRKDSSRLSFKGGKPTSWQSCSDLLELEALDKLHPQMLDALNLSQLQSPNAARKWWQNILYNSMQKIKNAHDLHKLLSRHRAVISSC